MGYIHLPLLSFEMEIDHYCSDAHYKMILSLLKTTKQIVLT